MNVYGVVMAGGGGTRFWPLSRKDMPKQFLNLTGVDAMVNETIGRLNEVANSDDIFVVTGKNQAEVALEITKDKLKEDHVLIEPAARNTAACVGYAAMEIIKKYGDGVMCVLPSDHYIRDEKAFVGTLKKAVALAESTDYLVTIGITPEFPATGYGYIKCGAEKDYLSESGNRETFLYHDVKEFVEKPDIDTAKQYLNDGGYLWNSGMFVWKASVILEEFGRYLPDIYAMLCEIGDSMNTDSEQETIERIYPDIPKISIDYGIMERAKKVAVLDGDFGWSDVGSFDALQALCEADENGNVLFGKQIHIDTHNCISYAKSKLIASIGVEDLIIVEADDAILVTRRDRAQDVGKLVERMKNSDFDRYL